MHLLEPEDVRALLGRDLTPRESDLAYAWVEAMQALLVGRYGDRLAAHWETVKPVIIVYAAAALERRLAKVNQAAEQESAGSFSVRWSAASLSGTWFLPAELADMDRLLGRGGTRSLRTPAPDGQRFANRMGVPPDVRTW